MTNGWHYIIVGGKPAMVRVCYTAAWNDPEWRKANGLSEKPSRRQERPKREKEQ